MLQFWLDCVTRAVGDAATFIGSSGTGIMFTAALGLLSWGRAIYAQVRQGGWRRVNWRKAIRDGFTNTTIAFGVVWLYCLAATPQKILLEARAEADRTLEPIKQERNKTIGERNALRQSLDTEHQECA